MPKNRKDDDDVLDRNGRSEDPDDNEDEDEDDDEDNDVVDVEKYGDIDNLDPRDKSPLGG